MAYLRFATRHLQASVANHIATALAQLGWTGTAGPVPLGTTAAVVTTRRLRAEEAVVGNLVAISFGDEPDEDPLELGGGLVAIEHHLFVDCVGIEEPHALSLASDVKDLLTGRAPGTSRFITLRDYTSDAVGTPVLGHTLEAEDVMRDKPNGPDWRAKWHVVKATITHTYLGQE